jgi:hypothetical protein
MRLRSRKRPRPAQKVMQTLNNKAARRVSTAARMESTKGGVSPLQLPKISDEDRPACGGAYRSRLLFMAQQQCNCVVQATRLCINR